MINKANTLFVILAVTLSGQAFAKGIGNIKILSQVTESKMTFESQGSNSYTMKQNFSRITGNAKTTGLVAVSGRNQKIDQVENRVPGQDYNGTSTISLRQASSNSNELVLVHELIVHDRIDGVYVDIEMKNELVGTIVRGTWQDYIAGETIQIELKPESTSLIATEFVKNLFTTMQRLAVKKALDQHPELKFSTAGQLKSIQTPGSISVLANQQVVELNVSDYSFDGIVRMKMEF